MHGAALFILWQVDARVFEGMLLDKVGKPCLINQHVICSFPRATFFSVSRSGRKTGLAEFKGKQHLRCSRNCPGKRWTSACCAYMVANDVNEPPWCCAVHIKTPDCYVLWMFITRVISENLLTYPHIVP